MAEGDQRTPTQRAADARALLDYVHSARLIAINREIAIRNLKGWLIEMSWGVMLTGAVLVALSMWLGGTLFAAITLIVTIGCLGATLSVGQRVGTAVEGNVMAGDSIYEIACLELGRNGLRFSILSGGFFAVLVFAIFASGLPAMLGLTNGIAPTFHALRRDQAQTAATQDAAAAFDAGQVLLKADGALAKCLALLPAEPGAAPISIQASESASAIAGNAAADDNTAAAPSTVSDIDAGAPVTCAAQRAAQIEATSDSSTAAAIAKRSADAVAKSVRTEPEYAGWIDRMRAALGVDESTDVFKLLVWAFIAGWAERLVPDMLQALSSRAAVNKKKEAAAAQS